jgi:hypothetical protein
VKKLLFYTAVGFAGYQYFKSKENREKAADALNKFYGNVEKWLSNFQQSNCSGDRQSGTQA